MKRLKNPVTLLVAGFLGPGLLLALLCNQGFNSITQTVTAVRPTNLFEQWVVVITAFGVKPGYMLLSALVIWLLRQRKEIDLSALRWGMILFLAGELACAINYTVLGGSSEIFEFLHDYGMLSGFSLMAFAAFEGIDQRVVKYSDQKARCAALGLCVACIKYKEVPCGLRRCFGFGILSLLGLSFMPLCATLEPLGYTTTILGGEVQYCANQASQFFEFRFCPLVAAVLLTSSWLVLQFKREEPVAMAKLLLAAALGPLGFSLLRLCLLKAFTTNLVWYTTWEEFTEFMAISGILYVIWCFRASLLRPVEPTGETDAHSASV